MRRVLPGSVRLVPALGCLALATSLLSSPADAARLRSTSGPIERTPIMDPDFCASEAVGDPGEFEADGEETTFQFCARNLGDSQSPNEASPGGRGQLWMFQAIDAISVLLLADYQQYLVPFPCCEPNAPAPNVLAWDLVDPQLWIYHETFLQGIPEEWSLADGAWFDNWNSDKDRTSNETPSNPDDCLGVREGGALGLGHFTNPAELVSTWATIPGFEPHQNYVLQYWWHALADSNPQNEDFRVKIWGEEPWEDVTPAPLSGQTQSWAAAWADVDGDGDEDVYLARSVGLGPKNQLLRNDGGGAFADVTTPALADPGDAAAASFADMDGDGDPDLLIANYDLSGNRVLRNDSGVFADAGALGLNPSSSVLGTAWADYDLDGDVDVYVSRTIGFPNSLYRNDGNFRFTDVAVGPLATTANTQGVAWGDYDDDGDPDLYVTAVGPNLLLRNDGGAFVNVATGVLADASITRDAAWGDADGDGDLDLALANYGSSDKLLRNVGGGAFVDATPPAMVNTDQSNSVTWQDVDLDSDLDLFVATTTTNHLLLNDGGGVWAESIGGPFPRTDPFNSFAGVFADMDSDGDPDVLVVNRGGEADQLFRNDDGAGEHWLAIDVKGTLSNTGGVGARIDLTAGGVTQRRDVGYDAPISSQGTKRALFGLGANTSIESISIRWPSGHVQVVSPPAVDQRIVVTENDPTGPELPDRRPERFALGRPFPNPFVGGTSLPLEAPRRTRATVEVFDVRGRRVRTVLDGPVEPGVTAVRWDGRDSEGARAAAGIYFVRCRAGEFTASRKITLR